MASWVRGKARSISSRFTTEDDKAAGQADPYAAMRSGSASQQQIRAVVDKPKVLKTPRAQADPYLQASKQSTQPAAMRLGSVPQQQIRAVVDKPKVLKTPRTSITMSQKVLLQDVGSEDKVDILKRIARSRRFLKDRADSDASAANTNSEDSTEIRRQSHPPRQSSSPTSLAALLQPTRSQSPSKRPGARRGKRSQSPVKARDLPRLKQGLAANLSEQEQIALLQQQVEQLRGELRDKERENPDAGEKNVFQAGIDHVQNAFSSMFGTLGWEPTLPSAILTEMEEDLQLFMKGVKRKNEVKPRGRGVHRY